MYIQICLVYVSFNSMCFNHVLSIVELMTLVLSNCISKLSLSETLNKASLLFE